MTQPAIAAAMGISLSTANRAHMAYETRVASRRSSRSQRAAANTRKCGVAEDKVLARTVCRMAGAGEMLNIHDLKAAYEKTIGHATSDSTVYNLLHRRGWRKLMPRLFHPKRDLAMQNAFKKNRFPDAVKKARRVAARRGRRLRIMFADEARFGRMNRIRRCRAPIGTRPRGRCPIHPRIHLFVGGDLSQGRHLRVFDHADLVLGVACFRPDQHAQGRWLADACDQAHRSVDRSRRATETLKQGVLDLEKLTSGLPRGSPSRPGSCLNANRQSDSFT